MSADPDTNRPVRTRTPGGVGGVRLAMAGPYPDLLHSAAHPPSSACHQCGGRLTSSSNSRCRSEDGCGVAWSEVKEEGRVFPGPGDMSGTRRRSRLRSCHNSTRGNYRRCIANTRATCSGSRAPARPSLIWWRQLVPSATTMASGGAARKAGSKDNSAICIETSKCAAS